MTLIKFKFQDLIIGSKTIYGEARNQDQNGKLAVASVIVNRVLDVRWPKTIEKVCLQKWQFSCWNENDANRIKIEAADFDKVGFKGCYEALASILWETVSVDPTHGANHYLTTSLANRTPPKWYNVDAITAIIGDHTFLKL